MLNCIYDNALQLEEKMFDNKKKGTVNGFYTISNVLFNYFF